MRFIASGEVKPPHVGSRGQPWCVRERAGGGLVAVLCSAWGSWFGLEPETEAAQDIAENLASKPFLRTREAITRAMRQLDEELSSMPDSDDFGPACSALAAVMHEDSCVIGWIGTCAAARLRAGEVICTRPHLLRDVLISQAGMTEAEARNTQYATIAARALGSGQFDPPDFAEWDVRPGDVIALGSNDVIEALSASRQTEFEALFDATERHASRDGSRFPDLVAVLVEVFAQP